MLASAVTSLFPPVPPTQLPKSLTIDCLQSRNKTLSKAGWERAAAASDANRWRTRSERSRARRYLRSGGSDRGRVRTAVGAGGDVVRRRDRTDPLAAGPRRPGRRGGVSGRGWRGPGEGNVGDWKGNPRFIPSPDPTHVGASGTGSTMLYFMKMQHNFTCFFNVSFLLLKLLINIDKKVFLRPVF